jgi:hypothetical protein
MGPLPSEQLKWVQVKNEKLPRTQTHDFSFPFCRRVAIQYHTSTSSKWLSAAATAETHATTATTTPTTPTTPTTADNSQ